MKTSSKIKIRNQPKKKYRIRNWPEYNEALKQQGNLTFWFDMHTVNQWYSKRRTGKPGPSEVYSDIAIECALTLKQVFHLPLRATEGLLSSLINLMKLPLIAPNYTTICRRQKKLVIQLPRYFQNSPLHVLVDATGLKVFGEGEWKTRLYGPSKRRTWRKLHLALDQASHEVVAAALTTNDFKDGELLADLIKEIPDLIK